VANASSPLKPWPHAFPADQKTGERSKGLYARQLGDVVEMLVACQKRKLVLDDQRGDPEIVGGNRRSLTAQLGEQSRVMMGGLFVRQQQAHPGGIQEPGEQPLILPRSCARLKTGPELSQDHKRQETRDPPASRDSRPRADRDTDRCNGWCRGRFSSPQVRVNLVLCLNGILESRIFNPGAHHEIKIVMKNALTRKRQPGNQYIHRGLVEAFPFFRALSRKRSSTARGI
jgi:hypothetical protein